MNFIHNFGVRGYITTFLSCSKKQQNQKNTFYKKNVKKPIQITLNQIFDKN